MPDPNKPHGCIIIFLFVLFALFVVPFAWTFFGVGLSEVEDMRESHHPRKHLERTDKADGPDFTTMDQQLLQAQEKGQAVFQIRLEGTPTPLEYSWLVKEVGYDVVVFEGTAGLMTLRMESIVGFQVGPEEVKKAPAVTPEPQVEK